MIAPGRPTLNATNNDILQAARAELVRYGTTLAAFDASICTCDEPECVYRRPETYPLHVLLQDVARAGRDRMTHPSEEPPHDAGVRAHLVALGDHFGLFRCTCGEPDCPTTSARTAPIGDLLYTTYVQWYAFSGCLGREGADQVRRAAEIAIRNLHAVRAWTRALSGVPRVFIEAAITAYAVRQGDAWLREAQILAVECSEQWIPHLVQFPEVEDAMDLVLVIAEAGEWTDEQAQVWLLLANDALLALVTRDLLDPLPGQEIYSGIEPIVPLQAVRAAVLSGETGAPPGFFAFAA